MNLSITKKILVGFLAVSLLGILGNLIMLIRFGDLGLTIRSMSESQNVLSTLGRMEDNVRNQKRIVQDFADMSDTAAYNRFVESSRLFSELVALFRFQAFWADEPVRAMLNRTVTEYNEAVTRFTGVVFSSAGNARTGRLKALRQILERVDRNLGDLGRMITDRIEMKVHEVTRAASFMSRMVWIILFLICALSLFYAGWVARSFAGPFRRLLLGTRQIGQGHFDTVIDGAGADEEVAELIEAFQEMGRKLQQYRDNLIETEQLRAVNLIATSVSHEVNNPLMIISGTAEYVRTVKSGADEDLREKMQSIIDEVQRISVITRKLARIKQIILEDYHMKTSAGGPVEGLVDINRSADTRILDRKSLEDKP